MNIVGWGRGITIKSVYTGLLQAPRNQGEEQALFFLHMFSPQRHQRRKVGRSKGRATPRAPPALFPASHRRASGGLAVQTFHNVPSLDFTQGRIKGVHGGAVLAGPVGEEGADWVFLLREGVYVVFLVAQLPCQMAPCLLRGAIQQLLHLLPFVG